MANLKRLLLPELGIQLADLQHALIWNELSTAIICSSEFNKLPSAMHHMDALPERRPQMVESALYIHTLKWRMLTILLRIARSQPHWAHPESASIPIL